ncbi:MAG: lipopolysaccharide biosynthesis protein [Actinomycetota bacterium]
MTGQRSGSGAGAPPSDDEPGGDYGTGGLRSLADRFSWAVVAEITNLGAVALVFFVLGRLLTTADYGQFASLVAIAAIVGPLSTFGANWILIRRGVLETDIRAETGRAINTAAIGTSGAVAAVVLLAVAVPGFLGDISRVTMLLVLVGQVVAYWLLELGITSAVAMAELRLAAIGRTVAGVIRILAVLGFLIGPGDGVDAWAWYFVIGQAVAALAVHLIVARSFGGPPRLSRTPLREFRSGFPYGLGNTTESFLAASDRPLLTQYGFAGQDGIYGAGYRVVSLGFTPMMALLKAQDRRFFRHGAGGSAAAHQAGLKMMVHGLVATVPVTIALFLTAPLLSVVLGDRWAEAETVIRALALLPFIKGFQFSFGNALTAAGNQQARMWLTGLAAVGNLIGNVILIPSRGWQAAAVTTLVAEVALAIGFWAASDHYARRDRG